MFPHGVYWRVLHALNGVSLASDRRRHSSDRTLHVIPPPVRQSLTSRDCVTSIRDTGVGRSRENEYISLSAWVAKSVVNQIAALISLHHKFRNRNMIPTESNGTNGHSVPARPISAATRLRKRLTETNDIIVAPGVYDGFSARIALEVGFDCLYMVNKATLPNTSLP